MDHLDELDLSEPAHIIRRGRATVRPARTWEGWGDNNYGSGAVGQAALAASSANLFIHKGDASGFVAEGG